MTPLKINLGCGSDHRLDYINVDGDESVHPDKIVHLGKTPLTSIFKPNSAEHILAHDIIEHLHHWEAVLLLEEIFQILQPAGTFTARLPNVEHIIGSHACPIEKKIELLYGGQDIEIDENPDKNRSRRLHPEFFCHRYGWTPHLFHMELKRIGFHQVDWITSWPNFITTADKPR